MKAIAALTAAAVVGIPAAAQGAVSPLRLADVPAGWTAMPTDSSPGSCGLTLKRPVRSAFTSGETLPDEVLSAAKQFSSVKVARRFMSLNANKIAHCRIPSHSGFTYSALQRMSFPRVGDQSFAFKLTISAKISGITLDGSAMLIMVRHRHKIAGLTVIGFPASVYQAEDLARAALRRLGR